MEKVNFSVLSNTRCIVCNTRLKQNLIKAKPDADMCYKHYQMLIRMNHNYPLDDYAKAFKRKKARYAI
jgi:hypothetical protein